MLSTAFAGLVTAGGKVPTAKTIQLVGTKGNRWTATHYYWYEDGSASSYYQDALATRTGVQFAFKPASTFDYVVYLKDESPQSLASLSGMKIVAKMTIRQDSPGVTPQFCMGWRGQDGRPTDKDPATVRLEFQISLRDYVNTDYWWSTVSGAVPLSNLVGNVVTLAVPVDPALWSDINGSLGARVPWGFDPALVQVKQIGLSFGGGSFAADGVALSAGAATFQLLSYQIVPMLPAPKITAQLSSSSIVLGSSVTVTATITGLGTSPMPTGELWFLQSRNGIRYLPIQYASLPTDGSMTVTSIPFYPVCTNPYHFRVLYVKDSNYAYADSNEVMLAVMPATPVVVTTLSSNSISLGGSVTDSVTVTGWGASYPSLGGTVDFLVSTDGGTTFTPYDTGVKLVGGIATSQAYYPSSAGIYYFEAKYNGDANYVATTSANEEMLTVS